MKHILIQILSLQNIWCLPVISIAGGITVKTAYMYVCGRMLHNVTLI